MDLDNRGFASAEFIFVTLIALIILGGMVTLISSEMDKTQIGNLGQARILGEKVATTINTAYANGKGNSSYSIDLSIPATPVVTISVNNVTPGYITVSNAGKNVSIKLIPQSVTPYTLNSNSKYHVINNGTTIKFIPF
jgi:uncharacterized protein (UPF0333 family)